MFAGDLLVETFGPLVADLETGAWNISFDPAPTPGTYTVRVCNEGSSELCDDIIFTVPGFITDAEGLVSSTEDDEDETTDTVAALFFPATFGGANLGGTSATTTTPLTSTTTTDAGSDSDILGATDDNTSWSIVNAALAGFVAILAIVALAGIRRGKEDNNTGARVFMVVPAAAAVIAFFVIESVGGSMIWFNVWTWLFGGILVVQAIVATLTTRTAND